MPLSVAKKLGFSQYKKCKLSLVLADRSVKFSIGILEDLSVMVGNCEIPTDFVVLEMDGLSELQIHSISLVSQKKLSSFHLDCCRRSLETDHRR
ncbi:hypothetical protein Bca4012_021252 [Brassica carinata]